MKIIQYIGALLTVSVLAIACKKDNYEAPKSRLTGRVVYQGQALGVRSNGVELELWQHGYAFFTKIPVFVNQDGTFSTLLFDGDYKLVRLRGSGPWVDNTDSIDVRVSGNTVVDVPVVPYFIIRNETFQKNGTTSVTANFNLQQVNTSQPLEKVKIYLGQTTIVDEVNNASSAEKAAAAITDLSQPISLTANIPADIASKGYVYARVGVKAVGVGEVLYTQPVKISLN